jgi:hypothetical protein
MAIVRPPRCGVREGVVRPAFDVALISPLRFEDGVAGEPKDVVFEAD